MKPTNYQQAREIFEKLVPKKIERKELAQAFSELILHAHAVGPRSWEVTAAEDHISLNVGPLESLVLWKEHMFCNLRKTDNRLPKEVEGPRYHYRALKGKQFQFETTDFRKFLNRYPSLKPGILAWIDDSAKARSKSSWKKAHSQGLVEYISELSGVELPTPGYYNPTKYWVQYHNYDNLGYLPGGRRLKRGEGLTALTKRDRGSLGITTEKSSVNEAIGDIVFLILGIGKSPKKYYLWSRTKIEKVSKRNGVYDALGSGWVASSPVCLDEIGGFDSFKEYCGRFAFGFQDISKHPFTRQLILLSEEEMSLENTTDLDGIKFNESIGADKLEEINERMKGKSPRSVDAVVKKMLREDSRIVKMLKRIAEDRCQFPGCGVRIQKKGGGYFSEVAHIEAVKHGGKSVIGNLLVLCPNHHKEFDHGDRVIEMQTPTFLKGKLNGKKFEIRLINRDGKNNPKKSNRS